MWRGHAVQTQHGLGRRVDEHETALFIGHDDAVAHAVEDGLEDPALLLVRLFGASQFEGPLLGRRTALGDAAFEGGVQRLQLLLRPEPLGHFALELTRARRQVVVGALERGIPLLNLREHRVEAVDQRHQFRRRAT